MHIGQITQFRRDQPAAERLHTSTMAWIVGLPEHLRPVELAIQFPRVANSIALVHVDKEVCTKLLARLMFDPERPDRSGFPPAVANEIIQLHNYFSSP